MKNRPRNMHTCMNNNQNQMRDTTFINSRLNINNINIVDGIIK